MSPAEIPQRRTLVAQTIALLKRGVREGKWVEQLPGQHALCAELVISRTTLRAALQAIARQGLIELRQGSPMRIRRRARAASGHPGPSRVLLLVPAALWRLRPSVARWASELRSVLLRSELELTIIEGGLHYSAHPEPHLTKLVAAHPHSAWVLFSSTHAMQRWFSSRGLPAILVGPVFPGISLPSIEYDHAAIAQHAARHLAASGHRRTAILLQQTGSAADATTCDAFAAARQPGTPPPLVLQHDGTLTQIESRLHRLAKLRERPTALFVTKSLAIPACFTILPRLGLSVPRDLSVICREDDPFLDYLVPAVARYSSDSAAIARKLAFALTPLAQGLPLRITHDRLMPRFVVGQSVAPPPAAA